MRERPILFNGPMVSAILAGSKTCTRRLVKGVALDWLAPGMFTPDYVASPANGCSPFGYAGDRLWVRETTEADRDTSNAVALSRYSADGEPVLHPEEAGAAFHGSIQHWSYSRDTRPNIHMPREMCRLVLEITDVRIERLHAGDGEVPYESRYLAEGINRIHHGDGDFYYSALRDEPAPGNWADPFDAWRELWESTGAEWDSNPWVWVVQFRRATP